MRNRSVLKQYWHVVQNDEIGGWAVTNFDVEFTSQLDHRLGHVIVADLANEEVGKSIVQQHNDDLRSQEHESSNSLRRALYDELVLEFRTGTQKFAVQQQIIKGSPVSAYAYIIDKLVKAMTDQLTHQIEAH